MLNPHSQSHSPTSLIQNETFRRDLDRRESETSGNDSTEAILTKPAAYLFFLKDMDGSADRWLSVFADIAKKAKQQNIPLYIVTSDTKKVEAFFSSEK